MRARDGVFGAVGIANRHHHARVRSRDAGDDGALAHRDAVVDQSVAHDARQLGVVSRQDRELLDYAHPRPELAERLRHLDADRTAADDDEMLGQPGEIEDGLVGEVTCLREPGNRRDQGPRAGGEHEAPGADALPVHFDRAPAHEPRRALDHRRAQPFEPLDRIVGRDGGDRRVDVLRDRCEIDAGAVEVDAQGRRPGRQGRGAGGCEQRLRRHAAPVQALAAHLALFDEDGGRAHLGRARGDRQAGRTGADHADVDLSLVGHGPPVQPLVRRNLL